MSKKLFQISYLFLFLLLLGLQNQVFAQTTSNENGERVQCSILIPDAFSPNGDNVNDRFVIKTAKNCVLNFFELQIFDSYGRLVFESKQISVSASWNGKFNNDDMPEGVYMYKLIAILNDHENAQNEANKISKQGSLILVR